MKIMYGMITNPGADWLFRDSRKKKSPPLFSAEEIDRMDPESFRGMSRAELAALRSRLEVFQEDFFAPDDCEVDSPAWKEWERLDDKLDELISRCGRFVLSDFSEGMLNKAKETLRNQNGIEYRTIDIQDIPFADHTFDVVIANMMLYHVPDLAKGLHEVKRVLRKDGVFYCATYGEHGMMEYIYSLFADYQLQRHVNDNFTLQNGEKKLRSVFSDVRRFLYEDSLEVTDAEDLADYIYSLTGMTDLQMLSRDEVRSVLEKNMQDGVLHVPKEYGMFVAGE